METMPSSLRNGKVAFVVLLLATWFEGISAFVTVASTSASASTTFQSQCEGSSSYPGHRQLFLVSPMHGRQFSSRKRNSSPMMMKMTIPLLDVPPAFNSIASAYGSCLMDHPLPTQALTAAVLCGTGDYLAQMRSRSSSSSRGAGGSSPTTAATTVDWNRLVRFAAKGLGGGIIWSFWYDSVDTFLDSSAAAAMLLSSSSSSSSPSSDDTLLLLETGAAAATKSGAIKVALSMVLEQFLWCPVVFSAWDIPVASVLNNRGGRTRFRDVKANIRQNLGGLLVDNAKVWTPANLLIYSIPVEYRVPASNLVDVFWQSIVADMAAGCGEIIIEDPNISVVSGFLGANEAVENNGRLDAIRKKESAVAAVAFLPDSID